MIDIAKIIKVFPSMKKYKTTGYDETYYGMKFITFDGFTIVLRITEDKIIFMKGSEDQFKIHMDYDCLEFHDHNITTENLIKLINILKSK